MPEIEVLTVGGSKEWTGDHGTFRIYDVTFAGGGQSGKGQIKKKADSPAPTMGEKFDGEIIAKGTFPPELKRAQKNGGGGGGWKPKSPEELRSINRSVAQKNAILLLGVEVQAGKTFDKETASQLLKPRIDYLFDDLQKAAAEA